MHYVVVTHTTPYPYLRQYVRHLHMQSGGVKFEALVCEHLCINCIVLCEHETNTVGQYSKTGSLP